MRNAENMALLFTGALGLLSRLAHLPIRALSFSADVVLKLIGSAAPQYPSTSPEVTELLVEQGATETAIRPVEERLISSVFDYSQRHVQDVMTQRTSIISFEVGISPLDALRIAKKLATAFFTRIFRPTMYRHILLPLDGES